jgi:hypothetical protein
MRTAILFICFITLFAACNKEKDSNAGKTSILTGAHWNNENQERAWHFDFKDDGTFDERFVGADKREVISMQGTWEWVSENEITLTTKFMTVQKEQQPIDLKGQEDSKKTFRFTEFTKEKLTGLSHANGDAENSGFAEEFSFAATAL